MLRTQPYMLYIVGYAPVIMAVRLPEEGVLFYCIYLLVILSQSSGKNPDIWQIYEL
jgi:hypothetical protein